MHAYLIASAALWFLCCTTAFYDLARHGKGWWRLIASGSLLGWTALLLGAGY